jgi:hypothetical protein
MILKNQDCERIISHLNNKVNQRGINDDYKIPDPIKSIPSYDGNRKRLGSWLKAV